MGESKSGLLTSLALTMVLFLSTSCVGTSGLKQCGLETRGVGASGRVALADGISTANGSASMGEAREPGRPDTEVATVDIFAQSYNAASSASSDFLRGHIREFSCAPERLRVDSSDRTTPPRPCCFHRTFSRFPAPTIGYSVLTIVVPLF